MVNSELVVVNVNGDFFDIWDFCDASNAQEVIKRAQESAAKTVATYESHIKNFPDRKEYWESCKAKYKNAKYEVMTFGEFLERQKKSLLNSGVTEITEENYLEMLNVLPPLKWCTINGVEMFCMREMYTGTYTNQYAKTGSKFYTAIVDITDQSTWIHNRL